jgi:hypothetical protein
VRYRIVTNRGRGRVILDGIDMFIRHVRARGWHLDGIYENRATRPRLVRGLAASLLDSGLVRENTSTNRSSCWSVLRASALLP